MEDREPQGRQRARYRLLHVIPDLEVAGAGRYLLTLLDALPGREGPAWRVGVVCPEWGRLAEALRVRKVPLFPLEEPDRSWSMANARCVRTALRSFRPHLVHTHASLSGRLAAALGYPRPRIIVTRHGPRQERYGGLDAAVPASMARVGRRLAGTLLADAVIAVSRAVAVELRQEGIPKERIHVIYNGIDVRHFASPPESARLTNDWARWDLDGCQVVAAIGRLSPEKGHHHLLQAVAHLRPHRPLLRCLLVGDGPERRRLQNLAADLNIGDAVIFAGWRDDVASVLRRVTLVAVPSLIEGIGLVLLESLAARRPVVASRVGGMPEVVTHGREALLVGAGDVPALTAAIEGLLAAPDFARELAARGHERVKANFSAESMARQTFALAQRVVTRDRDDGD